MEKEHHQPFKRMQRDDIPLAPSFEPALQSLEIPEQPPGLNVRVIRISLLTLAVGLITGFIAKGLVFLIDLITNLSFYGRFSFEYAAPSTQYLGPLVIAVPALGGLIIGLMARYGSKAIRGHGIPEAMEQVLTNESRIPPRITFLKPVSAAISIGTGGPFGAEGPIIATGGALGSFFGQILHTTSDERKILLTAGAAAGMASIFGSPVAAILLAVELLLFEFSPRSLIPVALGSLTGTGLHYLLFSTHPFFQMPAVIPANSLTLAIYSGVGALTGLASIAVTRIVYAIEDGFEKIPVHWMWYPLIGGLAVGLIGYISPLTMGVGYSNISYVLSGKVSLGILLSLCLLKFLSWSISLGSGTSGGTLAPLLTIGGAAGALIGLAIQSYFPETGIDIRVAALVGMAAMFAGASRAYLTAIVFALETTGQADAFAPLLAGCTASYILSFFLMKHSIMTEKIARRGVSIPTSYMPNYLENTTVGQVVSQRPPVLMAEDTLQQAGSFIEAWKTGEAKGFLPVVDKAGEVIGLVHHDTVVQNGNSLDTVRKVVSQHTRLIFDSSPLKTAAEMLGSGVVDILTVVSYKDPGRIIGILTHEDILRAYQTHEYRRRTPEKTITLADLRSGTFSFRKKVEKG